jgi:hypothetical protein
MWMRAYVAVSSLALVILSTAAFRQAAAPQNLGEITVERINVVDKNGTLRLVISNKDRQHPGVIDGLTIDRPRPVAGLLFFNDAGDEVGGLTFTGQDKDGKGTASGTFTFDQLHQDQTIGLRYSEGNGTRRAALEVWDRPDAHLGDLVRSLNAANAIADPERRQAAIAAARQTAPAGHTRVFVGKDVDRSASVALSDAAGTPRLKLTVDANGNPRIEFLDDKGQVTQRLPQGK